MKRLNNLFDKYTRQQIETDRESNINSILENVNKLTYDRRIEVIDRIKSEMQRKRIECEEEASEILFNLEKI